MKTIVKAAIVGGAFILGVGAGGASAAGGSPTSSPTPAPTVTVAGPTVTTTVTKTPQSCLDALDDAAQLLQVIADEDQSFAAAAQQGQSDGDVTGFINNLTAALDKSTTSVKALNPKVTADASACRNGS